jgi:hypothetical protein
MFKIFASLRRLLAVERSFKVLGAVASDAIEKVVIPALQKMANSARTSNEKIKYEALIGEYREYTDSKNPKAEEFAFIAEKVISGFAHRYTRGMQDAEEVAQNIASNFYTKPTWMQSFESPRFDARKGPTALKHHWATILHNQTAMEFRELAKKAPVDMGVDEGGVYDSYRNFEAPKEETYLDKQMYDEILSDLKKYIERSVNRFGYRGKLVPEVFRRWLSLASEKGADGINFLRDIAEPMMADLKRKKKDIPAKTPITDAWPIIKKLVAQFFEEELDSRISDRVKERLHLSAQDIVSYDVFRIKIARWVLSI